MGGHLQSDSSNAGHGQANQQAHSGNLHDCAMGNISGGIMRFNISAYNQIPPVDKVAVHKKPSSRRIPRSKHAAGQVAPNVKDGNSPQSNSQGSAKD